jgi:hypothetical protein
MHRCLGDSCKHVHATAHIYADCLLSNGYRTSSVPAVTIMLATVASKTRNKPLEQGVF